MSKEQEHILGSTEWTTMLLSAESHSALTARVEGLFEEISKGTFARVDDLLLRLHQEEQFGTVRFACPISRQMDLSELEGLLESFLKSGTLPKGGVVSSGGDSEGKLCVLFTGQGSQFPGMGHALYQSSPVFRAAFEEICSHLNRHLPQRIEEVIFSTKGSSEAELLGQTQWTQPALFALETALFRLWEALGIQVDMVLGHSIGELVAAHVSGLLSLEDAAKLVCSRGCLMAKQATPGGAMASLQVSEAEAHELIEQVEGYAEIAGINGPHQTVISGESSAVQQLEEHCRTYGRKTLMLQVSHAFHSAHMDAMLSSYEEVAAQLSFSKPVLPLISHVTGELASFEELCRPRYWGEQVRNAVRFFDGILQANALGATTFLECGPKAVLSGMARDCLSECESSSTFIASLSRAISAEKAFSRAVGALFASGQDLHLFSDM